jgi:hypothetical protein
MAPSIAAASLIADRYVIERELGRGGMATVYLAEDRKHGRLVPAVSNWTAEPGRSLLSKGKERIDTGRTPARNYARQKGNGREDRYTSCQHPRIGEPDSIELRPNRHANRQGDGNAGRAPDRGYPQGVPENRPHDVRGSSTHGDANADLLRTANDIVRQRTIHPDQNQKQRDHSERSRENCGCSLSRHRVVKHQID